MQRKNWAGALFANIYELHTRQSNMSPCWVVSFTVSCLIQWQKFDAMDNKICHYLFDIYTLKSSPKCTQKLSDNYKHARYSLSMRAKTKLSASKTFILF